MSWLVTLSLAMAMVTVVRALGDGYDAAELAEQIDRIRQSRAQHQVPHQNRSSASVLAPVFLTSFRPARVRTDWDLPDDLL